MRSASTWGVGMRIPLEPPRQGCVFAGRSGSGEGPRFDVDGAPGEVGRIGARFHDHLDDANDRPFLAYTVVDRIRNFSAETHPWAMEIGLSERSTRGRGPSRPARSTTNHRARTSATGAPWQPILLPRAKQIVDR
jgi:hypothetical protein